MGRDIKTVIIKYTDKEIEEVTPSLKEGIVITIVEEELDEGIRVRSTGQASMKHRAVALFSELEDVLETVEDKQMKTYLIMDLLETINKAVEKFSLDLGE